MKAITFEKTSHFYETTAELTATQAVYDYEDSISVFIFLFIPDSYFYSAGHMTWQDRG